MNIWDSVHRGLEKASSEAGRIARCQRVRSSIDKVGRQINEHEKALLYTVVQLFNTGKLSQAELLPLCQELMQMHQQVAQLQAELQQIQQAQPPGSAPISSYPDQSSTNPSTEVVSGGQSSGQFYADAPLLAPPPPGIPDTLLAPPPPGISDPLAPLPGASDLASTILTPQQPVTGGQPAAASVATPDRVCRQCGVPAMSPGAFCQNCGAALGAGDSYQPTALVSSGALQGPGSGLTPPASAADIDDSTRLDETSASDGQDATPAVMPEN